MYNKEICTCITCDNCGELYTDEHTGYSLYVDEGSANEAVDNDNWHSESGTHYCPACYSIDDEDNVTINFSRKQPAPATPLPQTEVGEDEMLANNSKPEYIICAAIHFVTDIKHEHQPRNIISGFVVCGRRHHNCFTIASLITDLTKYEAIQGFLTSKDRFVSRKNAGKIAFEQKQISEPTDCLFSEDLY